MGRWNLSEVAVAVGASLAPNQALPWPKLDLDSITTDSRNIQPGCLFVALRGERFDGHDFVQAAARKGAAAVMVDEAGYTKVGVPALIVQDTLRGLGDVAKLARRRMGDDVPVVGVTGSNGKTTTKELLAAALGARGPVHKTEGNFNNLIGVPKTLFGYSDHDPAAWAAVVEMGMNAPGEIARLAEIAEPDVGLITCVGQAHLEGLGTIDAVAKAKCELLAAAVMTTAVINADDDMLVAAASKVVGRRRVLTFGSGANCDVQLVNARPSDDGDGLCITLFFAAAGRVHVDAVLPLVGWHNALNAAGAAAAAFALGMEPDEIARGLEAVQVPGRRLRVHRNVGVGVNLVDDSYNSNPASTRAALSTVCDLAASSKEPRRRIIAILGDMFELGPTAPEMHHHVGLAAAESGVDAVYAAGPLAEHTAAGARAGGIQAAHAFSDVGHLQDALHGTLNTGDWVLIKGSRGMHMERLVDWIVPGL